jgi:phosphatidylglycerophosphatase C
LPQILRPKALEALESFNKRGDKVLIVSASAEHWLQPWAALYEVYVIASRLEVHNGRITGKLAGKNCYGPEKILRLKAVYDLDNYTEIVVFRR